MDAENILVHETMSPRSRTSAVFQQRACRRVAARLTTLFPNFGASRVPVWIPRIRSLRSMDPREPRCSGNGADRPGRAGPYGDVASAKSLRCRTFVTYDDRQARLAKSVGLRVVQPLRADCAGAARGKTSKKARGRVYSSPM